MQTEFSYVNELLSQVANTTIPAVAVEGSMYGAVGTSAEVTMLATQFLPPQVTNAINYGFNPQVYASEALGLAFAFGNRIWQHRIRGCFRTFSRWNTQLYNWRRRVRSRSFSCDLRRGLNRNSDECDTNLHF